MQCVKLPFCKVGDRGFESRSGIRVSNKSNVPSMLARKESILWGNFLDREVASLDSDRQGSNFESCIWRAVSSPSSPHPQEVLLDQFGLYVNKGSLKPHSFHLFAQICLLLITCLLFETLEAILYIVVCCNVYCSLCNKQM